MRTVNIDLPWASRLDLVFIGDVHTGNVGCQEKLLSDTVGAVMAREHAYIVDLGDSIDAINMQDKRFDPSELASWMSIADLVDIARSETERYADIMRPAKDRILARLRGNHEEVLSRHFERDVYGALNAAIGVPDERCLGVDGFLRLRIADNESPKFARKRPSGSKGGSRQAWNITCYIHHGTGHVGKGRLAGAHALGLERLSKSFRAEIYAVGHGHYKMPLHDVMATAEGPVQIIKLETGSFLGSYKEGVETYAERGGMYPRDLGPIEVWLYPETREMRTME
jgi:hypothetical protein